MTFFSYLNIIFLHTGSYRKKSLSKVTPDLGYAQLILRHKLLWILMKLKTWR